MSAAGIETDPRFPSGRWAGFFTDKRMPGNHAMELLLTFSLGKMVGSGRDRVGEFVIDGAYQLNDGKCMWMKQYIGKHAVGYRGFNEGKGIWGTWILTHEGQTATGGFRIWPDGVAESSGPVLAEEADIPFDDLVPGELVPAGA